VEEPLEQTISARQLGAAFSGCFLGAGYVSGREMWQFFGRFGPVGWLGLCLSIALLGGAGLLLLTMVRRTGRSQFFLFWIQTIKKESFKLSRGDCVFVAFWSSAAMVSNSVLVAWLTALCFRNVAFALMQRCIGFLIPVIPILPAPDRPHRNLQSLTTSHSCLFSCIEKEIAEAIPLPDLFLQ